MGSIASYAYNLVVHSGVYMSLGAMCCVITVLAVLDQPLYPITISIGFLATFAGYNLNHLSEFKEDIINYPSRVKFLAGKRLIFIPCIIFSYVLIFILSLSNLNLFLVSLFPFAFVFLYTIQWVPLKVKKFLHFRRLKEIPFIKNFFVAFSWAACTYLLVLFSSQEVLLTSALTVVSFFIFVRVLLGTIAFDLRDIAGDARYNIKTLPVLLGYRKTLVFLFSLNSFSFVIFAVVAYWEIIPFNFFWVNLTITIFAFIFLYLFTTKFDKKVLCDVIVIGQYILAGISSLLTLKI